MATDTYIYIYMYLCMCVYISASFRVLFVNRLIAVRPFSQVGCALQGIYGAPLRTLFQASWRTLALTREPAPQWDSKTSKQTLC